MCTANQHSCKKLNQSSVVLFSQLVHFHFSVKMFLLDYALINLYPKGILNIGTLQIINQNSNIFKSIAQI